MKRLLNSTAALSVALMNVQPWPVMAQTLTDNGAIIAVDGTVLCEPSADAACDPNDADLIEKAQQIEAKMGAEAEAAAAKAEAQAKADAEAATAEADAQAKADAEAAATEADAQAKADADAAAEADAQAKADAEAAATEVDAQAKADAEAAATEADAQAKADAEAAATEADAQAKADAEAAAAEADAQAKADAEAAAMEAEDQTKVDADAADKESETQAKANADAEAAAAEAEAQSGDDAEAAANPEAAPVEGVIAPEEVDVEADAKARAAAEAELGVKSDGTITDPSAGLKTAEEVIDPAAVPVEAPEVSEEEIKTLTDLLSGETTATDTAEPSVPFASAESGLQAPDAAPSADAVTANSVVLTEDSVRRATEEFAAAPQVVSPGKKNKLSDLEKAGLVVLGALAVGTIINHNKNVANQQQQQVVSNTGDRVVVLQPDGSYQVYKDDDALLRQAGNTQRTETYKDGSTRTIMDRPDGSQIITIRNATGRVLQRVHYDSAGNERMLINDLAKEQPIVVSNLPKPRNRPVVISPSDSDVELKAALARLQTEKVGRSFSLRQVREISQVRHLAAMIDVDKITFASGSSALSTGEINALSDLGTVMRDILDLNKNEVFLVEGHTDAVGKAAMNLALSDRRAETVALALTQYFNIPPENMVVQGYGEDELLIDTQADEKRNRRVAVRLITPLL